MGESMRNRTSLRGVAALAILTTAALVLAATAAAATVVVTQNSAGWAPMDTRPGGAHRFTEDYGAPAGFGSGSLELTTNATTTAKADYWTLAHAGTALASVTDLSYWTYQAATPQPPVAAVSYQVQLDTDGVVGDGAGFTTLVYEPYWNGVVVPATWQSWDVDAGQFWSSRTTACGLVAGAGGPPLYSLAAVKTLCPNAVVLGIGVNEEELSRLFERFYRADRARASRGTGLGLAIVKHIVASAGGTVEARGQRGRGLEIRCVFPTSSVR
jgi:hypothetical protein